MNCSKLPSELSEAIENCKNSDFSFNLDDLLIKSGLNPNKLKAYDILKENDFDLSKTKYIYYSALSDSFDLNKHSVRRWNPSLLGSTIPVEYKIKDKLLENKIIHKVEDNYIFDSDCESFDKVIPLSVIFSLEAIKLAVGSKTKNLAPRILTKDTQKYETIFDHLNVAYKEFNAKENKGLIVGDNYTGRVFQYLVPELNLPKYERDSSKILLREDFPELFDKVEIYLK